MSHYFNERIYNEINYDEFTYPTLEYGLPSFQDVAGDHPFDIRDKLKHLNHIFNKDQLGIMVGKLGRSIYFTHVFTELVKNKSQDEDFEQLLELNDPYFRQIRSEFSNRLNKIYTHPLLGDLLDSGEIDFAVLNILEQLYNVSNSGNNVLNPMASP